MTIVMSCSSIRGYVYEALVETKVMGMRADTYTRPSFIDQGA